MHRDLQLMYDLGFEFFPLAGKVPVTTHGFKDATRDRETLSRMVTRHPHCNWGGLLRGTICLDIDPRNGGTINGLDLNLEDTLVVETGSGGLHIYYRFDGRVRGKLEGADGIDLKHWATGYLVMPGSIHPDTGKPYFIANHVNPAPLPGHLRKRVEQSQRATPFVRQVINSDHLGKKNSGLVRRVAEAQGGGRNHLTFWAFCRALERGADPQLIDDIRSAALSTDLPEHEVETCLRSARNTIRSIA